MVAAPPSPLPIPSPLPVKERMKVRVLLQRAFVARDSKFRLCSGNLRFLSLLWRALAARFGIPLPTAALMLALAGCARVAQPALAPRPVLVNIPVATPIYCNVPALDRPQLAIAALTEDSPPADTIRSYAATVDVLKSAVLQRDAILKGCAAPPAAAASSASASINSEPDTSADVAPLPTLAAKPQPLLGQAQVKSANGPAASSNPAAALLSRLRGWLPW
jgi:hypothetical protein